VVLKGYKVPPRTGAAGKARGNLKQVSVAMPFVNTSEFDWL